MLSISSWRQSRAASASSFDWYSCAKTGPETQTRQNTNKARSMDHPREMPGAHATIYPSMSRPTCGVGRSLPLRRRPGELLSSAMLTRQGHQSWQQLLELFVYRREQNRVVNSEVAVDDPVVHRCHRRPRNVGMG